jgi:hypothetical protein
LKLWIFDTSPPEAVDAFFWYNKAGLILLSGYGFSRSFRQMQIESVGGQDFPRSGLHLVSKKKLTWCAVLVDFRFQIKYS